MGSLMIGSRSPAHAGLLGLAIPAILSLACNGSADLASVASSFFATQTPIPSPTPTLTPTLTPTPSPTLEPSPTPKYTTEERDQLISFCSELSTYLDADAAFWELWDMWEPNLNDSNFDEEYEVGLGFQELALELQAQSVLLSRPRAAREIVDSLSDSNILLSQSIYALANHYYDGNTDSYDKHSQLWQEAIDLYNDAFDRWEDLAKYYDFDPWLCQSSASLSG